MHAVLQERCSLGCFTRLGLKVKQIISFELMESDPLALEQNIHILSCLGQVVTIKLPAFCWAGLPEEVKTDCSGSFWGSHSSCTEVPRQLLVWQSVGWKFAFIDAGRKHLTWRNGMLQEWPTSGYLIPYFSCVLNQNRTSVNLRNPTGHAW